MPNFFFLDHRRTFPRTQDTKHAAGIQHGRNVGFRTPAEQIPWKKRKFKGHISVRSLTSAFASRQEHLANGGLEAASWRAVYLRPRYEAVSARYFDQKRKRLCLMSWPTRNTMIRQLQKASGQALALNPYIVENPVSLLQTFRKWNYSILVFTLNIKTIISNSLPPSHRILE
jgi:hypothetical protein